MTSIARLPNRAHKLPADRQLVEPDQVFALARLKISNDGPPSPRPGGRTASWPGTRLTVAAHRPSGPDVAGRPRALRQATDAYRPDRQDRVSRRGGTTAGGETADTAPCQRHLRSGSDLRSYPRSGAR